MEVRSSAPQTAKPPRRNSACSARNQPPESCGAPCSAGRCQPQGTANSITAPASTGTSIRPEVAGQASTRSGAASATSVMGPSM